MVNKKNTPANNESDAAVPPTEAVDPLQKETQDGPGSDPVPPADFDSFATAGVEKKELLSIKDVVHEMLGGRWGSSAAQAMGRLRDAGYDTDAVWAEFQRRKAGGAPSAF